MQYYDLERVFLTRPCGDDDIDVGMPREDFDKLIELYPNTEGGPYLQSLGNDGRIFYGGYARLRDAKSTMVEAHNRYFSSHKGIFIDILPLDRCAEDPQERKKLQKKITEVQRCIYARAYTHPAGVLDDLSSTQLLKYTLLGRHIPFRFLFLLLDRLFHSVPSSSL